MKHVYKYYENMVCIDAMEKKMKFKKMAVLCLIISCMLLTTVACEKERTAEKAGKSVDRAFDSAKQKLNEATK